MAGQAKWPASYVVPSVVLSLTATGFLVWHVVDRAAHIDGWAITLLVVGFLPWLRTVFESIEFPGGGSVKYQKLEAKQEQQDDEIKALQFLVANFLDWRRGRISPYLRLIGTGQVRRRLRLRQSFSSGGALEANRVGAWKVKPKSGRSGERGPDGPQNALRDHRVGASVPEASRRPFPVVDAAPRT